MVSERIIELRKKNIGQRKIAAILGVSVDVVKYHCKKHNCSGVLVEGNRGSRDVKKNEELFRKDFSKKFKGFEYCGGYVNSESTVSVRCLSCGEVHSRVANCLRSKKVIVCKHCSERKRLLEKKKKEIAKINEKLERLKRKKSKEKERLEIIKNKIVVKQCGQCGNIFETTKKNIVYCSCQCRQKKRNAKDKRIYKNGIPDLSITLDKLRLRDCDVCYICGGSCDSQDYYLSEEGYFIVGGMYPSIDHVKAIANGGEHVWNNVKLAHVRCNTLKRDKNNFNTTPPGLEGMPFDIEPMGVSFIECTGRT